MHASTLSLEKKHLAFPDKPDKVMQVQSKSQLKRIPDLYVWEGDLTVLVTINEPLKMKERLLGQGTIVFTIMLLWCGLSYSM